MLHSCQLNTTRSIYYACQMSRGGSYQLASLTGRIRVENSWHLLNWSSSRHLVKYPASTPNEPPRYPELYSYIGVNQRHRICQLSKVKPRDSKRESISKTRSKSSSQQTKRAREKSYKRSDLSLRERELSGMQEKR